MSLWSDFLTNDDRLIHKWKHYFPIYERHFREFVYKPLVFLEIGCGRGGSVQMWKRYFGPHATIVGVDVVPECKVYEEDQIEIRIGAQQDTAFLQALLDEFGPPDIVLDDGSHVMTDMVATFEFLYPRMPRHGVYMAEDLHAAYWDEYEGGYRRPGTFIELCKGLIDELNADHARGAIAPTEFTATTLGMHLYDSVAVFERGTHTKKTPLKVGNDHELVPKLWVVDSGAGPQPQPAKVKLAEAGGLASQVQDAVSARDEARAELQKTRASLAAAEDTLTRMQRSLSWRVTEPVRRLMTALRSGESIR